jgi:TIR domain
MFDVFVAHASPDKPKAAALADLLRIRFKLTCFLDADSIRAGAGWPIKLKQALTHSRVIAILVSAHSDDAYFLQEEVQIAIQLLRNAASAVDVVPVLLQGARLEDMPYGTMILNYLSEDVTGLDSVADGLAGLVRPDSPEGPGPALGRTFVNVDEMWTRTEHSLSDLIRGDIEPKYRQRIQPHGEDLVSRTPSAGEIQRVTRAQLESKLSPDELAHIAVLERSMEVSKAIWDERYPKRLLDKKDKRLASEALEAMGDDLDQLLTMVERAGLYLDDHYLGIRAAVERLASGRDRKKQ